MRRETVRGILTAVRPLDGVGDMPREFHFRLQGGSIDQADTGGLWRKLRAALSLPADAYSGRALGRPVTLILEDGRIVDFMHEARTVAELPTRERVKIAALAIAAGMVARPVRSNIGKQYNLTSAGVRKALALASEWGAAHGD